MYDRFAPLTHLLGMFVEPALDSLKNMLMLPTRDPAFAARLSSNSGERFTFFLICTSWGATFGFRFIRHEWFSSIRS
jgi:hypothetical protein